MSSGKPLWKFGNYDDFAAAVAQVAPFPELSPREEMQLRDVSGGLHGTVNADEPPAELQEKIALRIAAVRKARGF